jgi:hypothetical protein
MDRTITPRERRVKWYRPGTFVAAGLRLRGRQMRIHDGRSSTARSLPRAHEHLAAWLRYRVVNGVREPNGPVARRDTTIRETMTATMTASATIQRICMFID